MNTIALWLFVVMSAALPPEKAVARYTHPEARETVEDRVERYRGIATAIGEVVTRPNAPLLFSGSSGPQKTALLYLAVTFFESGWRRDVDLGIGKLARGEGMDSCLSQLRIGTGKTAEGWTHEDLTTDRRKCVYSGLAKMRLSMGRCKQNALEERLSAYASGSCESDRGRADSRKKFSLFSRWGKAHPIEKSAEVTPGASGGAHAAP